MPRKPWIKLSTGIISSTTWVETAGRNANAFRVFIALLVSADENGVVSGDILRTLPRQIWLEKASKVTQKWTKAIRLLTQIGTISTPGDGTIILPKYREYQYMQGFRADLKRREVGQLPRIRAEQIKSRAEQNPPNPPAGGKDSAPKKRSKTVSPSGPLDIPGELLDCESAIREWLTYKQERGQSYRPAGFKALMKKLMKLGAANVPAAIEASMASNWAGVFAVQDSRNSRSRGSRIQLLEAEE